MFIVGALAWWYTDGWRRRFVVWREQVAALIDYFSIDLLLRTLFSPYRQISASRVSGSIAVKWRAFVDRMISRVIGAIVRLIIIVVGIVAIILFAVLNGLVIALWAAVPLLPLIGIGLTLSGWTPSW